MEPLLPARGLLRNILIVFYTPLGIVSQQASALSLYTEIEAAPATWQERGIVLPCTSPALAFARLRQSAAGHLEIVLRRPDGVKGYYAIRLKAINEFASPTLFDRVWLTRLSQGAVVDQSTIARARNEALRTGLAGRAALAAAERAEAADRAQLYATLAGIMGIVANAAGPEVAAPAPTSDALVAFAREHRDRFGRMAARIGATAETFTEGLRRYSEGLLLLSRLQRDVQAINKMRTEVEDAPLFDETEFQAMRFILDASEAALQVASQRISQFRQQLNNPLLSISCILRDQEAWLAPARQAAFALDGWRFLASFWDAVRELAPGHEPRAIWCLGRAAPPLPAEIDGEGGSGLSLKTVRDRWPAFPPRLRAMGATPRQDELEWAIVKMV